MTWKELRELINQMSPEEQEDTVMIWGKYRSIPDPAEKLERLIMDMYYDGTKRYFRKNTDSCPNKSFKLVLKKGKYYINV